MSLTRDEQRVWTQQTLDALLGSPGRAGLITKETIATALGVSESTVSRWVRGDGVPVGDDYRRLRWLARQRRTWYLRFSPFVLAMWSPPDEREDDFDEQLEVGRYFSEITYTPTDHPAIARCELKLATSFRSFALLVLGPRRHELELAHTEDGAGQRTLHFDRRRTVVPGQKPYSLRKGSVVSVFLKYLV